MKVIEANAQSLQAAAQAAQGAAAQGASAGSAQQGASQADKSGKGNVQDADFEVVDDDPKK